MSSTKFIAIMPQTVQSGDKVRVRGTVAANAEQFSINFVNETCAHPQDITYHFKWILPADIIVEDYKQNGVWMDHKESEYNAFDGRLSNTNLTLEHTNGYKTTNNNDTDAFINPYSILGPTFALEFAFQDDGIYVYLVHGEGRNIVTHYEPENDLSDIESIQVWGDVEKINELAFSYK